MILFHLVVYEIYQGEELGLLKLTRQLRMIMNMFGGQI